MHLYSIYKKTNLPLTINQLKDSEVIVRKIVAGKIFAPLCKKMNRMPNNFAYILEEI
jgi:hypothetical protein